MIDKIDLKIFKRIIHEGRHNADLLDSYSINQFRAKERLINHVEKLGIVNENSEIVIMGGWYGSIFIPAFKHVKKITLIDLDKEVINIATNRLFYDYDNVEFICDDVFETFKEKQFKNVDLFINTSCEHMRPMKEWGPLGPRSKHFNSKFGVPVTRKEAWWERVAPTHFAFQSNNMFHIPTHINCCNTIEEFKEQLPNKEFNGVETKVLVEDKIKDERGTRFLLIGEIR